MARAKRKHVVEAAHEEGHRWLPSKDLTGPIRPNRRFGSHETPEINFCDTRWQVKLVAKADTILRKAGFFDAKYELEKWLDSPIADGFAMTNREWVLSANPHSITGDGHLAASAVWC